ncbi:chromatin modification-related protein EAF7 isoform X1 [Senna tora]|uniref:Chromatin modification-related protein EAF7 isoform X1 n=1 Tax=Senna tora TaxID=362788 RepID=A0A834TXN1_9FABA|nr:chromatin modification-related protein EAF7 isoform X1 [Senna tora]
MLQDIEINASEFRNAELCSHLERIYKSKQRKHTNQRTRGFKLKYVFQVFLLIAVAIWLLYQLKHSIDQKKEYDQTSANTLETPKLGRKALHPKDLIDDEKIKEIVGREEVEESEEVEDLIDEEDKEREEEINEEEESEDMGKQIEDISSVKDKSHEESKQKSEKSRVMRQTQSIGSEFEFGGLEHSEKTDARPKVVENVTIKHGSFQK